MMRIILLIAAFLLAVSAQAETYRSHTITVYKTPHPSPAWGWMAINGSSEVVLWGQEKGKRSTRDAAKAALDVYLDEPRAADGLYLSTTGDTGTGAYRIDGALGIDVDAAAGGLQINAEVLPDPAVSPAVTEFYVGKSAADLSSDPIVAVMGERTAGGGGSSQGLEAMIVENATSGTVSISIPLLGNYQHRNTGTVSEARAVFGSAQVWGGGTTVEASGIWGHYGADGSSSTCTTCSAITAAPPFVQNSGAVTTGIGVWIKDQLGTTQYGLKQDGADDTNLLAGATTVSNVTTVSLGSSGATPTSTVKLVVEDSAAAAVQILGPDANAQTLYLGSATAPIGSLLTWRYSTGLLRLATAKAGATFQLDTASGGKALEIDASQNATFYGDRCQTTGSGTVCDYGLQATAPATCSIGDSYKDTSGALCHCESANTWGPINKTGTCV